MGVEGMPNKLTPIFEPLDPGIAPIVELLRQNGIDTFASCEGGEGHMFSLPTVRIAPRDVNDMRSDIDQVAIVLSEAGFGGYYLKQVYAYQDDPFAWDNEGQHFIELEFWSEDFLSGNQQPT